MKKSILFFNLFVLASCGITYDAETRLIVETKVIDSNGNALANREVEIYVHDDYDSDIISMGKTNANGNLLLVFPSPDYSGTEIDIRINPRYYYEESNGFQQKSYTHIKRSNFDDHKMTFDPAVLYRNVEMTSLDLTFESVSADSTEITETHIEGPNPEEEISYFVSSDPQNYSYPQQHFTVLRNQEITLHYTVYNTTTQVTTEYAVPISVGAGPVAYNIQY